MMRALLVVAAATATMAVTDTFVENWCNTDEDCWAFGDGRATCLVSTGSSSTRCSCRRPGYANPVVNGRRLEICVDAVEPTTTRMVVELNFTAGDYSQVTNGLKTFLRDTMATVMGDPSFELYQVLDGSIVVYGGAEVNVNALSRTSSEIAGEVAALVLQAPEYNSVLSVAGSNLEVSSTFAGAPSTSCEKYGAAVTLVTGGRCIVLRCHDDWDLIHTETESYCDHDDPSLSAGEIIGLICGIIILLLLCCFLVFFCCIKKKEQPEQSEEMAVREVVVVDAPQSEEKQVVFERNEPFEAPSPVVVPPKPEPTPEPEPEPVHENAQPVVDPVAAAIVPVAAVAAPTEDDKDAAARKIQKLVRVSLARKVFLRSLQAWKAQEEARKAALATGKTGSIGCILAKGSTKVARTVEGGGAEEAGMLPGDLIVVVQTKGRGGAAVYTPVSDKVRFMEGIGPAREVFEGSVIKIIAFRDPAAIEAWESTKPADPEFNNVLQTKAWVDAARAIEPREEIEVTVKPETEKTEATRLKNLNKIKEEKGIEDMNVELVNAFMADPEECMNFTKRVYLEADADNSGFLQKEEIKGVFNIMAKHTGCPVISDAAAHKLFYIMDVSGDGEVSFEEFYPHFRSYQLQMIHVLLFGDGNIDDL